MTVDEALNVLDMLMTMVQPCMHASPLRYRSTRHVYRSANASVSAYGPLHAHTRAHVHAHGAAEAEHIVSEVRNSEEALARESDQLRQRRDQAQDADVSTCAYLGSRRMAKVVDPRTMCSPVLVPLPCRTSESTYFQISHSGRNFLGPRLHE